MRDVILDKAHDTVMQANGLSQSCYNMPVAEKRLLALGMMYLKGYEDMEISFCANDAIKALGIKGENRAEKLFLLRQAGTRLMRQIIKTDELDGSWTDFSVITQASYYAVDKKLKTGEIVKAGSMTLVFNSNMAPLLKDFRTNYAKMYFLSMLRLSGKYSHRLFELLWSMRGNEAQKTWIRVIYITDLRQKFVIKDSLYKGRMNHFIEKVITPAVTEINEQDLEYTVVAKPLRDENGTRFIDRIEFTCTVRGKKIVAPVTVPDAGEVQKKLEDWLKKEVVVGDPMPDIKKRWNGKS